MSQEQAGAVKDHQEYAQPGVLVDVDWVKGNLGATGVRLVEVDVDPELYPKGHIEGAIGWNWRLISATRSSVMSWTGPVSRSSARTQGSRTTRPSCCTATRTTGSPAGHSGSSRCTATRTFGS